MTIPFITLAEFATAYGLSPPTSGVDPTLRAANYTTRYKERWDNIAYRMYGDPTQVTTLIQMNPSVAIACELPQGTNLVVAQIAPPTPPASTTPWQP
jgi:hypothetical protein